MGCKPVVARGNNHLPVTGNVTVSSSSMPTGRELRASHNKIVDKNSKDSCRVGFQQMSDIDRQPRQF